jgi:hypothetical protein
MTDGVTTSGIREAAGQLRVAMAALTVVCTVAFAAVGAFAPAVISAVAGGAITAFIRSGRPAITAIAGLVGLLVVVLSANFVAGGAPESWGDVLFVYGGGLLGLGTVVLATVSLAGSRNR